MKAANGRYGDKVLAIAPPPAGELNAHRQHDGWGVPSPECALEGGRLSKTVATVGNGKRNRLPHRAL